MHDNIKRLWAELQAEIEKQKRYYKLDDKHAACVEHMSLLDTDRNTARLIVYEKVETTSPSYTDVEWDSVDLDSLPARLLVRVAEIKVEVERYNQGEVTELPASTMPNFLTEQDGRRRFRRYRR